MPRPEEFPIKFQFAITREMDAAIADWRRKQEDLPNRSQAIRRLVERGLASESNVEKPRRSAKRGTTGL
jgi:hypothetical protein